MHQHVPLGYAAANKLAPMGQGLDREGVLSIELAGKVTLDAGMDANLQPDDARGPMRQRPKRRIRRKSGDGTGVRRPSRAVHVRLITLDHVDRRSYAAKRAFELIMTLENERGGSASVTESVKQLCQRAALLGVICEDFESRYMNGGEVDLPDYLAIVATQRRVLQALGLQRQGPRDVTPSLGSYLADRAEAPDDDGEGEAP